MLRSQQHPGLPSLALNGTDCFAVSQPALGVPAGLPWRPGQLPRLGPASLICPAQGFLLASGQPGLRPESGSGMVLRPSLWQPIPCSPGLNVTAAVTESTPHTTPPREVRGRAHSVTGLWLNVTRGVRCADWLQAIQSPPLELRVRSVGKNWVPQSKSSWSFWLERENVNAGEVTCDGSPGNGCVLAPSSTWHSPRKTFTLLTGRLRECSLATSLPQPLVISLRE